MFFKRKRIYKVFFSWQSDTKGRERAIIEHALKQAKNEIKNQYGYEIEIDHSTLGEVGMPTIEVALLRKIDRSDIFICDITPVTSYNAQRANGIVKNKQVPNANVLIELGYAMSAMGSEYIIPVAHAGSWDVSDLPFDINHKRVYLYSSKDCSLVQPILAIIEYVNEYGKHRVLHSSFTSKIRATIDIVYNKWFSRKNIAKPLASIESTALFSMRMAKAFPGKRGLVEYTKISDIKRCLSNLLAEPLTYSMNNKSRIFKDPIWWYRGGSSMHINVYRHLVGRRFLIGNDEILIKRLVAYVSPQRYYNQYVYIECAPDAPTGLYPKRDLSNYQIYEDDILREVYEEYGIFHYLPFLYKHITRDEYDDGATCIMGKNVSVEGKTELRVRYLTKYNFVITAKGSVYNNQKFDRSSRRILWQMLEHTISKEKFNEFMLSFHKGFMLEEY